MRAPSESRDGMPGRPGASVGGATAASTSIVRSRLFIKYVLLFVAVVSLALIANGAFDVYFSYQEQKASLVRIQREQAEAAAGKIGQFISEIESQVGWTTQLPWSASTLEQRRFDALRLLRQVPAITELAEVDASGHEQLKVSRLAMEVVGSGTDMSKDPAFTEAMAHKVYFGPVYFRRESEPYMTLSLAGTRRDTGVSIAQVNLKLIWDVLSKIKFAGHGRAYVVDADGRLIAHPDISLVLRNTDMSQLAQVKSARTAVAGSAAEQVQEAVDIDGHKVLTASAPVSPLGWHVFVETPIEEAYAPLYAALERTALVLLGALALAFAAGLMLARRMVVPIQALRAGAARLGSGDLGQRIAIKTGDEVEALANQFNDMAGRLQEFIREPRAKSRRTHTGAYGIAGAADGNVRCAARHIQLARRSAAHFRGHAGECRAHLRRELRQHLSLGRSKAECRGNLQCTACVRGGATAFAAHPWPEDRTWPRAGHQAARSSHRRQGGRGIPR